MFRLIRGLLFVLVLVAVAGGAFFLGTGRPPQPAPDGIDAPLPIAAPSDTATGAEPASAAAAPPVVAAGDAASALSHDLEMGLRAVELEEWDLAVDYFRNAYWQTPDAPGIRLNLALAHDRRGASFLAQAWVSRVSGGGGRCGPETGRRRPARRAAGCRAWLEFHGPSPVRPGCHRAAPGPPLSSARRPGSSNTVRPPPSARRPARQCPSARCLRRPRRWRAWTLRGLGPRVRSAR